MLAALRGDLAGRCDLAPDAVVGLAGAYDVTALPDVAQALSGVPQARDPELWASGNPLEAATERPELPVLLLHGDADDVVPPAMTNDLAVALRDGGHSVDVVVLPGEDHTSVYSPEAVAQPLLRWLRTLPREPAPHATATSSNGW